MNTTHGRQTAGEVLVRRRQVLQGLGALPMAAGLAALSAAAPVHAQKVATQARIVILGSGLGILRDPERKVFEEAMHQPHIPARRGGRGVIFDGRAV